MDRLRNYIETTSVLNRGIIINFLDSATFQKEESPSITQDQLDEARAAALQELQQKELATKETKKEIDKYLALLNLANSKLQKDGTKASFSTTFKEIMSQLNELVKSLN